MKLVVPVVPALASAPITTVSLNDVLVGITEFPIKTPGFQVICETFDMAVKFTNCPLQIPVSVLAVITGIGITVTFTVSFFVPQLLATDAIKAVVALGVTETTLPVNAPGFQVMGEIFDNAVKFIEDPLQILESVLAINVGIGMIVTFTVSTFTPQALDTVAI